MWATLQLQTRVRYVTVQQKYPGLKIVVQRWKVELEMVTMVMYWYFCSAFLLFLLQTLFTQSHFSRLTIKHTLKTRWWLHPEQPCLTQRYFDMQTGEAWDQTTDLLIDTSWAAVTPSELPRRVHTVRLSIN